MIIHVNPNINIDIMLCSMELAYKNNKQYTIILCGPITSFFDIKFSSSNTFNMNLTTFPSSLFP